MNKFYCLFHWARVFLYDTRVFRLPSSEFPTCACEPWSIIIGILFFGILPVYLCPCPDSSYLCSASATTTAIFAADTPGFEQLDSKKERKHSKINLHPRLLYLSVGVEKIYLEAAHPTMHRTNTVPFRPIVQSRITRHNELNTSEVS